MTATGSWEGSPVPTTARSAPRSVAHLAESEAAAPPTSSRHGRVAGGTGLPQDGKREGLGAVAAEEGAEEEGTEEVGDGL